MRVSVNFERHHALVVNEKSVEKLFHLLTDTIGPPSISANCTDEVIRRFSDPGSLFKYENPLRESITSLHLYAEKYPPGDFARVTLGEPYDIRIEIEGESPESLVLRDKIVAIVEGLRPWYAIATRIPTGPAGYLILGAAIVGSVMALAVGLIVVLMTNNLSEILEPNPGRSFVTMFLLFPSALLVLGSVLKIIQKAWFPHTVFAIGQGADRHEKAEKFRWTCVVGLLVSLVASAVIALLSR